MSHHPNSNKSSHEHALRLALNERERQKLKIISRVVQGDITCVEAAECLDLSLRQIYRLRNRYLRDGDEGLIHGLRGTLSNFGYGYTLRKRVCDLYRERYSDYGPTLFAEMLAKDHTDTFPGVHHETLRRWLIKADLWSGAERRRKAHRRKRERRKQIGSLVQFDGSHHDWFEGRGPACCLLVAIDDASGRVFLRFAESENTRDVLMALKLYVEHFGIPRELYTDKAKIYHPESKGGKLTDVGRALNRLGVRMILAHSPQAKGRVERSNRTHQDRLIKALRRMHISTIEAANRFLDETYLHDHNNRFACPDGLRDIHRSAEGIDLEKIFCFEMSRRVYNDFTITLGNTFIQLEQSSPTPLPPPGRRVTLRRYLDGSLHIFWNEQELSYSHFPLQSKPKVHHSSIPAPTHPWRYQKPIGKSRTRKITSRKNAHSSKTSHGPTSPPHPTSS